MKEKKMLPTKVIGLILLKLIFRVLKNNNRKKIINVCIIFDIFIIKLNIPVNIQYIAILQFLLQFHLHLPYSQS